MGFIVGDILAQRLTGEAFDAVRSLELGLYGTLLGSFATTVSRLLSTSRITSLFLYSSWTSVANNLIVHLHVASHTIIKHLLHVAL